VRRGMTAAPVDEHLARGEDLAADEAVHERRLPDSRSAEHGDRATADEVRDECLEALSRPCAHRMDGKTEGDRLHRCDAARRSDSRSALLSRMTGGPRSPRRREIALEPPQTEDGAESGHEEDLVDVAATTCSTVRRHASFRVKAERRGKTASTTALRSPASGRAATQSPTTGSSWSARRPAGSPPSRPRAQASSQGRGGGRPPAREATLVLQTERTRPTRPRPNRGRAGRTWPSGTSEAPLSWQERAGAAEACAGDEDVGVV
jgi:hypothetical protein